MSRRYIIWSFAALCAVGAALSIFSLHRHIDLNRSGPAAENHTMLGWPAQVEPLAGDGVAGAVEGVAAQARFADPFGIVVDGKGNAYVSDAGDNNRIRKISLDGRVATLAGAREGFADGAGEAAAFHTPSGLAIDAAGNLYVADTGNNAIRKVTPQGVVSTLAGDGKAGYRDGAAGQARFNGPIGVAVDAQGDVYVADTYNDRIRMVSASGQVSTVAGGALPGYRDGSASDALFDTPCAVALGAQGQLLIADTGNNAIRAWKAGQVSTVVRTAPEERKALFRRPLALAATADHFLYIGTAAHGRVFQLSPAGELHGLTGVDIDYPSGDNIALRFEQPSGIAVAADGSLLVADDVAHRLRKIVPKSATVATAVEPHLVPPQAAKMPQPLPWPFKPQTAVREIVGTMGEVRGNDDGDSRDHFHAGLDVQAAMGTPVLAVAGGKVADPLSTWAYGELSEGLGIDEMSYIHMRVGRSAMDEIVDPERFILLKDAEGKPRVRVKRGTRFEIGDTLGSVNRMFHTHLEYRPAGEAVNPFMLGLKGVHDKITPHIESIDLFGSDGQRLAKARNGSLHVPRAVSELNIVVDAWDQIDGNASRRRLGLYKLGYQVLHRDGAPVPGFEQPRYNIEFNQLPPDRESVKIAYADGSGETVHGNAATHFRYVVTNTVRDGIAKAGSWNTGALPRGEYLIRIFAADYMGNMAEQGRDLQLTLQ